jgi:hypothetical protein
LPPVGAAGKLLKLGAAMRAGLKVLRQVMRLAVVQAAGDGELKLLALAEWKSGDHD